MWLSVSALDGRASVIWVLMRRRAGPPPEMKIMPQRGLEPSRGASTGPTGLEQRLELYTRRTTAAGAQAVQKRRHKPRSRSGGNTGRRPVERRSNHRRRENRTSYSGHAVHHFSGAPDRPMLTSAEPPGVRAEHLRLAAIVSTTRGVAPRGCSLSAASQLAEVVHSRRRTSGTGRAP